MMPRILPNIVICAALSCAGSAGPAYAEKIQPLLEPGMSTGQVIARWGEPNEKVEHETRRTVIWTYSFGKVIFQQGKLVVFPSREENLDEAMDTRVAAIPKRGPIPEPPSDLSRGGDQKGDDILSEVLREVPSDDDKGASSRPGGPPATGGPSLIRPLPGNVPQTLDAPDDVN